MNDQDLFGELRALLHLPYERERWSLISALLGSWSDQEELEQVVLPYVEAALKRWPDERELRSLPERWVEPAYELWCQQGRLPAYFSLIEQVSFSEFLSESHKRLALKLLELPWRSQLKSIVMIGEHALISDQALISLLLEHAPMPQLKVLTLSWCELNDEALEPLLLSPMMASVEELELGGSSLDVRFIELLSQSEHLGRLRRLDLSYTPITGAMLAGLSQRRSLGALEQIRLDRCELGARGFDALFTLPVFSQLKSLTLSEDFPSNSASLVALESASWNDTLEELTISFARARAPALEVLARRATKLRVLNAPLHAIPADALARLMRAPWRLHELNLGHPSVLMPGDFSVLAHAPALEALRALDLARASLNLDDFKALAMERRALERLRLDGVKCSIEAWRLLCRAPWFRRLKSLSLVETELSQEGVEVLAEAEPRLDMLNLSSNKLAAATFLRLLATPSLAQHLKLWSLSHAALGGLAQLGDIALPAWSALSFLHLAHNQLNDEDLWWLLTRLKPRAIQLILYKNPLSGELFERLHNSPLLRGISYLEIDGGDDFERHKQLLLSSPYAMPWLEVVDSDDWLTQMTE